MALEQDLTIRTQQFQMLQEKMVAMATAPSSPPRSQAADQEKKDDSWQSGTLNDRGGADGTVRKMLRSSRF